MILNRINLKILMNLCKKILSKNPTLSKMREMAKILTLKNGELPCYSKSNLNVLKLGSGKEALKTLLYKTFQFILFKQKKRHKTYFKRHFNKLEKFFSEIRRNKQKTGKVSNAFLDTLNFPRLFIDIWR